MTHLFEVAGMALSIPFVRFGLVLIALALLWDAYAERRSS